MKKKNNEEAKENQEKYKDREDAFRAFQFSAH